MTMRTSALAAATLLVAMVPAAAQTITDHKGVITTTRTEQVGKRIDKITCREFLSLRDRFQPQAVSYAVGYTKAHKPEDAVYDISGIDRLTPVVVKTCQTRPEETLLQRIRTLLHRL